MTCPGCRRANDPRRRYCGGCGINLEPVCQRCDFSNDRGDHFCGGCGCRLLAGGEATAPAVVARPPAIAPPVRPPPPPMTPPRPMAQPRVTMHASPPNPTPPRLAVVSGIDAISRAELDEMLAPVVAAEIVELPQGTINQDDLDRLFGGGS